MDSPLIPPDSQPSTPAPSTPATDPPHWMSGRYRIYHAGTGHRILATLIDWWLLWMFGWTLFFFALLSPAFGSLAILTFGLVYLLLMPWAFGGTLGKLMVGLRITTTDGAEVSIIKIFAREFIGKGIVILVLGMLVALSFISLSAGTLVGLAAFTIGGGLLVGMGREWLFHDRMFNTMVIRLEKVEVMPAWAPPVSDTRMEA